MKINSKDSFKSLKKLKVDNKNYNINDIELHYIKNDKTRFKLNKIYTQYAFEFVRVSDKVGLKWYKDNTEGFVNYNNNMEMSNKLNNTLLFEAERYVFGNNVHNYGEVNDQDKMIESNLKKMGYIN